MNLSRKPSLFTLSLHIQLQDSSLLRWASVIDQTLIRDSEKEEQQKSHFSERAEKAFPSRGNPKCDRIPTMMDTCVSCVHGQHGVRSWDRSQTLVHLCTHCVPSALSLIVESFLKPRVHFLDPRFDRSKIFDTVSQGDGRPRRRRALFLYSVGQKGMTFFEISLHSAASSSVCP